VLLLGSPLLYPLLVNDGLELSDLVHQQLDLVQVLRLHALFVMTVLHEAAELPVAHVCRALSRSVSVVELLRRHHMIPQLLAHPLISVEPEVEIELLIHSLHRGGRTQRSLTLFYDAQP
jgi:hypothetical protein